MEKIEIKTERLIRWWNEDGVIPENHIETLIMEAELHINEMEQKGFTSGDLASSLEYQNYRGYWELKTQKNY